MMNGQLLLVLVAIFGVLGACSDGGPEITCGEGDRKSVV
jgi:hypothetical protein